MRAGPNTFWIWLNCKKNVFVNQIYFYLTVSNALSILHLGLKQYSIHCKNKSLKFSMKLERQNKP